MKDTDADVRELRRMLAVPAERGFPAGRMGQREEHLMNGLQEMRGQTKRRHLASGARRWTLAGGALAAAAGIAAVILTSSQTTAYAVTPNGDGTVTVVVNDIADPAGANRLLQKAGVRAVVMLPKATSDCPVQHRQGVTFVSFRRDNFGTDLVKTPDFLDVADSAGRNNQVHIRPNEIPADQLVIIAPVPGPTGPLIQISVSAQPGPTCIINFTDSWLHPTPITGTTAAPTTPAGTVSPFRPRRAEPTSSLR